MVRISLPAYIATSNARPVDAASTSSTTPSLALQQSILGSIDELVSSFAALASAAQGADA